MLWIKLAWKEVRNNLRFSLFFIFNLTLGLVGFIALDSFKVSIHQHIAGKSKAMLSADIDIRSTYELSEEDLAFLESSMGPIHGKTRRIDFLSMVAGNNNSRLVQILSVDDNYPLYGFIILDNNKKVTPQFLEENLLKQANTWVQPELLTALNVRPGESLSIGSMEFTISDVVRDTSSGFLWSDGLAYTLIMGIDQAKKTGLISTGSRRSHHYLYKLPQGADLEGIIPELNNAIFERFGSNPALSVRSHKEAGRRITRFLGYLNDYLGLVSLVALFLAGVGTAYLFRSYLAANFKQLAILMILGADRMKTYLVILFQLMLLGTIAAGTAVLLSVLFLPILAGVMQDFLPEDFNSSLSLQSIILALSMGLVGSILFCLPVLSRIHTLKPLILFNENYQNRMIREKARIIEILSTLPVLAAFWFLSFWQSHSWFVGTIFILSLLGAFFILGFLGWFLITLTKKASDRFGLIFRLALRNLYRNRTAVLSSYIAIGLGALLINLIPQIDFGLQKEIKRPENLRLPSFFLFDIQPDQVEPLKEFLSQKEYSMENLSPWIESRLTHINGERYMKDTSNKGFTREERRERYSRRRTQNLSYRLNLYDSETIVAGQPFSGVYDPDSEKLPEISLDDEFAGNLGVRVGDTLTFDIQGIPIKGRIVNLRKIKWQSVQPNFFVIFQPGILDNAPSTFLGTIYKVRDEDKVSLQNAIVKEFPNISMVDISMAVDKILEITGQISWAIQVMAFSAIFVGLIVVYSIARYNSHSRQKEINLLKVLGAGFGDIRRMILLEFVFFGLTAATIGSFLSLAASWILSYFIFDNIWAVTWSVLIATIFSITLMTMIAAYLGTRNVLKQRPVSLLQAI